MNDQHVESTIAKLLEDLQSNEAHYRNDAIKIIVKNKINDQRVIDVLLQIVSNDPSQAVRDLAQSALDIIADIHSPDPGNSSDQNKVNYVQLIAGFIGWYLIATIFSSGGAFGLITTPATLIALIGYGRSKQSKGVAGGILIAVSLNFVISLVKGLSLNAWCLIPFYNGIY